MKHKLITKIGIVAILMIVFSLNYINAAEKSPNWPVPSARDQVIHNQGNIGVAVANFGFIGDLYYSGVPSGRWPANSDRDYLAEMSFWIGGINDTDDTLLANTSDDFNPIMHIGVGSGEYDIIVSNDTSTYDYDPSDTTGLGIGYPAYGWQVWESTSRDWEYNQVYSSLASSFFPGGPVSVQESICRFGDDATGNPVMGIEVTQTVRQWNYKHINNMILITMEITNASTENYHDVAFGLYCDFDIGGRDPNTGENGRLGDLVAVDTALDMAWTYDEDGFDPGWGPGVRTGYMGTVFLSTPGNVGLTSFNTGQWELLPSTDQARFDMINDNNIATSLPPTDQYYVQGVRGMDLPAGATIRLDFALIAGSSEEKLKSVANDALSLFNKNYISSRPPDPANAKATPKENKVTVFWDNTSELSVDPSSNSTDFRGYKVFRSSDRGSTWGLLMENVDGSLGPDYVPLAKYERDAFGRVPHAFTDFSLINGMEYWYAVVPYDSSALEIDYTSGTPDNSTYIVEAFPRSDALGYIPPSETIEYTYSGNWRGDENAVSVYIVDEMEITGDDYAVTFTENCTDILWNLINTTSGDTVLANQDQLYGLPGTYPAAEGLQIAVNIPNPQEYSTPDTSFQSQFATSGVTTIAPKLIDNYFSYGNCFELFRNDIEIRFTETGSIGHDYAAWYYLNELIVQVALPFEVWDVSNDVQLDVWIVDWSLDGEWTVADGDWVMLTNYDYGDGTAQLEVLYDFLTWTIEFNAASTPSTGDVFTILGNLIVSPEDKFTFSSEKIIASQVSANLDNIRVVPNPYIGYAKWESGRGMRKIQFTNLPDECTIRVYTLSGELIRKIDHDDFSSGTEDWNMLSESGKGITAGLYLFNVESQYGNYNGKFAVIK